MKSFYLGLLAIIVVISGATGAAAQTVTATWDANTDGNTAGYRLYYGTNVGAYTTNVDVGNTVSRQVTLAAGSTYYFVVRAYNTAGELGPESAPAQITLTSPTVPPTASLTGSYNSNGTAALTWQTTNATAVTLNGASVALSGSAQYPISATTTYTLVATGPGGSRNASTTVVVPVVNCQMSSWTFSSATTWSACTSGQRTRTETWTRTILTQPSGGGAACGATTEQRPASESCSATTPTAQITATPGTTSGTAVITWQTSNATSATINGAAVALTGTMQRTISQTTTYTIVATGASSSTSAAATVTPRIDCALSAWSFQSATAWGACTGGQRSRTETWARSVVTSPMGGGAACGATQEQRVISEPCGTTTAPTASITATAGPAAGQATVSWQTANAEWAAINGSVVGASGTVRLPIPANSTFTIVARGPGGQATASAVVTGTPVDCVLSDWSFQSATAWGACEGGQQSRTETWVRSIITPPSSGGAACGATSEQRTIVQSCTSGPAAPGVPTNFRAGVSGNQVTLSWNPPATGGAPLDYRLWVGTPGVWELANGIRVGNVLSVSARLPNGSYTAMIAAINEVALGPTSPHVTFRVGAKARPRSPIGFTASLEDSVATLSWAAPAGDMEDSPTGYVIEAGSASGLANLAVVPVGAVSRFQAVVPPGTYFVRVKAVNTLGAGAPSEERILRSGDGPGAPQALTVAGTGNLVALSWQPPTTGVVPASYVIEAGSAPGLANLAVLRTSDATSFTTTAPEGVYYVRIRGVAPNGVAGEASNEIVVQR